MLQSLATCAKNTESYVRWKPAGIHGNWQQKYFERSCAGAHEPAAIDWLGFSHVVMFDKGLWESPNTFCDFPKQWAGRLHVKDSENLRRADRRYHRKAFKLLRADSSSFKTYTKAHIRADIIAKIFVTLCLRERWFFQKCIDGWFRRCLCRTNNYLLTKENVMRTLLHFWVSTTPFSL